VPYQDETVVVDIPPEHYDAAGRPLFDSVSIWCLAARVNFADARLEAFPASPGSRGLRERCG
jgi:hypothetical protein